MARGPLRSMTGFGRAAGDLPIGRLTVEARSLNSRFLEVGVKAPRDLAALEMDVRRLARERLVRGKVDLFLNLEATARELRVDLERAAAAARSLQAAADLVGDRVRLDHLLAVGEVARPVDVAAAEDCAVAVLAVVGEALDRLTAEREREGAALGEDLSTRIGALLQAAGTLRALAATGPERVRQQVAEALDRLGGESPVDPQRMAAEVALLAQKADATEEATRLRIHLETFLGALDGGGSVGRRLDFLVQEIQREINTLGSKAALAGVSPLVVEFKTELEKVREQVQNLE